MTKDKGADTDVVHSRQFESEARERLATMETQHDNLEEKVDELKEGQKDILDSLGDLGGEYVEEDKLDPLADEVEKNVATREKAHALAKFIVVALTLAGGFSGAAVVIL